MGDGVAGRSTLIDLDGSLLSETNKAFFADVDGTRVWLPKSLVEYDGHGQFTMPEWLAIEKGLV